jgi:hypothetical protein
MTQIDNLPTFMAANVRLLHELYDGVNGYESASKTTSTAATSSATSAPSGPVQRSANPNTKAMGELDARQACYGQPCMDYLYCQAGGRNGCFWVGDVMWGFCVEAKDQGKGWKGCGASSEVGSIKDVWVLQHRCLLQAALERKIQEGVR